MGSGYDYALRGYPVGVSLIVPTYIAYDLNKLQVQGASFEKVDPDFYLLN